MKLNNSMLREERRSLEFSDKLTPLRQAGQYKKCRKRIHELLQQVKALEARNDQLQCMVQRLSEQFPEQAQPLRPSVMMAPPHPSLTRREKEVLDLLTQGMCAKEIAHHLSIRETTVITHKKNLKRKFNVRNSVELISRAFNLPDRYPSLS